MDYTAKRVLEATSLEVFSLHKNNVLYGAIQKGVHHFYAIEKDSTEYLTSTAKFTHVWLLENEQWKLSRSLSYDHQNFDRPVDDKLLFIDKQVTNNWLQQEKIPALGIGVIENGKIQDINVYGHVADGHVAPNSAIFNVASLTKPITATIALKLISTGKLSLDEPIYPYFNEPDIQGDPRSKQLTIRHILSHQTGFPNWRWGSESGQLAFEFAPGTQYQYSGEGFEILRKVLVNKFNKSLNELAKELIFTPLQMKSSSFFWKKQMQESAFVGNFDAVGNNYNLEKYYTANGADNVLTTVEDYAKFMISVMTGEGLSKEVFTAMVTPQVSIKNRKYFGLGFELYELENGNYVLSHGGADQGVQTLIFMIPNTKKGLIIFTNADEGYKVYFKAIEHFLGETGKELIDIETAKENH